MSITLDDRLGVRARRQAMGKGKTDSNLPWSLWRLAVSALLILAVVTCVGAPSMAQSTITMNQYALSQPLSNPWSLTPGPDGALWFTVSCPSFYCGNKTGDTIGRISTSGEITEYPLPDSSQGSGPYGITAGSDGALWFTELQGNKIGRATTAGIITEYPLPTPNAGPYRITAGPDGALWFTEINIGKIGRITTTGVITEYCAEAPTCSTDPTDIVAGPDRALWFTNLNSHWIGRMDSQHNITKYPVPELAGAYGIAAGPDKALWFTGGGATGAVIWRISTDGIFSKFDVPTKEAGLVYITAGPDKALWFTENVSGKIGRVTTEGVFSEYPVGGFNETGPVAISRGPDNAVWFGKLGYITQILVPDTVPPVITACASPKILWPPNGQMVPVTVSGRITDTGSGVIASSAEYAVTDEYRLIQPRGHMTLDAAGNYSFTVLLRASREGDDQDGRRYVIRLSARDNAGNHGTRAQFVTVPHDRR